MKTYKSQDKKYAKSKVATKKWSRLMAKNLIETIQVNLVLNPSETFLATTSHLTYFLTLAFWELHPFFTAWLFLYRYNYTLKPTINWL